MSNKYRFHVLGLVHLPVHNKFTACAFTMKIYHMCDMLMDLGHEVYLYGAEYSNARCTKFIQTHTMSDIRKDYGDGLNLEDEPNVGYDTTTMFRNDFNSPTKPSTHLFNTFVADYINKIKKEDDFLLLSQGTYQKAISDAVKLYLTCEPGIGYRGSFADFKAFESSYIQNFTYGGNNPRGSVNGNYYDRVIPNYFDGNDFTFSPKSKDYYLYLGRMIIRKGVWTAIKATEAIGAKLILAGQTDPEIDIKSLPKHCEYVGVADAKTRNKLMGNAIATFTPTEYLEPFCGVHIESQLTGTPVLTTNFSVFPETVRNGVNGYRCDTLDDFVWASEEVKKLDRKKVRECGERYLMDRVQFEYQKWFEDLYQLYLSSKDDTVKGWHNIRKQTPEWRKLWT